MTSEIGFALLLSALAGLSTTIGSLLGLFVRKPGLRSPNSSRRDYQSERE